MKIGDKIKNLLKVNKLSLSKFCVKHNLVYTTMVNQINTDCPSYELLEKLYIEFPQITIEWLFNSDDEFKNPILIETNRVKIEAIIKQLTELKENL